MAICAGCDKRPTGQSKWCSQACRKRTARAGGPKVVHLSAPDTSPNQPSCESTASRELEAAGRLDTTLGQACLVLARRIDANADTGSALAGAVKQLEATMAAATRGAQVQRTALDELRARRDAKRGA